MINWTKQHLGMLGTIPDSRLAGLVGCHKMSVRNMRLKLEIPAFDYKASLAGRETKKSRLNWTKEMDAVLGTVSDKAAGEQLGLHYKTVVRRRLVLKIPAYRTTNASAFAPNPPLLSDKSRELIKLLSPVIAQKWKLLGVPIDRATPRQVIEHALSELAIIECVAPLGANN